MAELADALDSGSSEVTLIQVQVLLSAPNKKGPVSGPFLFGALCRDRRGLSARSTRKGGPGGPPFLHFSPLKQKQLPLTGFAKHLKCQKATKQTKPVYNYRYIQVLSFFGKLH